MLRRMDRSLCGIPYCNFILICIYITAAVFILFIWLTWDMDYKQSYLSKINKKIMLPVYEAERAAFIAALYAKRDFFDCL